MTPKTDPLPCASQIDRPSPGQCDLCGLNLQSGDFRLDQAGKTYRFCCPGCRQVFSMLVEISGAVDPEAFRKTEIFRRCREAGVIPSSESDVQAPSGSRQSERRRAEDSHPSGESCESALTVHFDVIGMWCPACSWVIEEALRRKGGILDASCLFAADRLKVDYDPLAASPAIISAVVDSLGYQAVETGTDDVRREKRREFLRFGISAFLVMNVMMLSFSLYSGFFFELPDDAVWKLSWPILILSTAVLLYGGRPVFVRGWKGIVMGSPGMESLIAVGAGTAWGYSVFNFLRGSIHLYFDTASMLITLVLLGKLLERNARERIHEDLGHFFSLLPRKVRLCTTGFPRGRYVDAGQLEPGGIFRVGEGDRIPADGIVVEGAGVVNEAVLTGESRPLPRSPGDRLMAGGTVEEGDFRVRAEKVGADSTLGAMVTIMEGTLEKKTTMEDRTDLLLRWFVPVVLALAAGTLAVGMAAGLSINSAVERAIAVMVISCPCAFGIAIPLTRVAGISLAGRNGILVREFGAFESAGRVRTVVFDKTGTLTEARWALRGIYASNGWTPESVLAAAAGLEKGSDHPIAVEIRRAAHAAGRQPMVVHLREAAENGVAGFIDGRRCRIGSASFLADWMPERTALSPDGAADGSDLLVSRVYLGVDGVVAGVLHFGDRIKPGAGKAIEGLRQRGLGTVLVSGDDPAVTEAAGRRLGIAKALGGQLPADKANVVEALKRSGGAVAMVGDGVNDAQALAASDLGVAVFAGNPLGREAADITLMGGDPLQMGVFLDLARQVNRKIRQNLVMTFVYNVVSIPLAMSGMLSPLVAVCAMLLSSLSVTGNTLRLVRRKG
ncbi:MAG: heavy metal translocating P-type ATPase [Desulfobacterales bacterium]